MKSLIKIINDDTFARKIATDCHDKDHDIRWCPTCENRINGINEYRDAILNELNKNKIVSIVNDKLNENTQWQCYRCGKINIGTSTVCSCGVKK